MKNNSEIFLQFDFKPDGAEQAPLLFSNPVDIITTTEISEVAHCLEKVDQIVDAGKYVAGYVSYEIIYAMQNTDQIHIQNTMPLLWFGVFEMPTDQFVPVRDEATAFDIGEWEILQTKQTYEENFQQIKAAIHTGETEQINYTVPFETTFSGNSYTYYNQLKKAQSANFCAYLALEHFDILSASPELFFRVKDDDITVRPMKGTIHRGKTYKEDLDHKEWLANSEKNKFENKLITELMKQELMKVTDSNSLHIVDRFRVEKYPTVYQMTTGLTGKVLPELSVMELLTALFPCGSIAGVPKDSSMTLIKNLEKHPREVYCGAIGYITPEKEAVFNVPIRTVWIDREKNLAHYGAGGAITEGSTVEEEFKEVLTKTNVLTWRQPEFDLLETIGLYEGNYTVLNEHMTRLGNSADYFDIPVNIDQIREKLMQLANGHAQGNWRIRLTINKDGVDTLKAYPLQVNNVHHIRLANRPIDQENVFLYHKTTYRKMYDELDSGDEALGVLLWNQDQEITECTIGNIVVELDGHYYTPPVSSGLLPGTFRKHLLDSGEIKERIILKEELPQFTNIWLINSVRKWVKVRIY